MTDQARSSTTEKLSPLRLFAYALPAVPIAALGQPFYMFAPTFYAKEVGIGAGMIGLILLIVRVLDAASDLAAGRLSDQTGGRFGRRRPWVLLASPLAAWSAYMIMTPPDGAGAAYFALWTLLVSIFWAAITLPLNAWGAELSPDYRERIVVTAWREIATVLGVIGAVGLVAIVSNGGPLREALAMLGLFAAITTPLACGICVLLVPDPLLTTQPVSSLKEGLKDCAANEPFRRLVVAYVINGIANGLPATLFLYFVSERLGRPDLQGALLGTYFLAGLISAPFWAWLGGRYGKDRVWRWAMVWACLIFALALGVTGPKDWILFLIVCVGSGLALGADIVLPAAMQADVVDLDELKTGQAPRTGLYFALWSVATKLALAVAAGAAFGILGLVGFNTQGGSQTELALNSLVALYCAIPIGLKLISIILMRDFPIDAAEQARIRAEIAVNRRNSSA
jgi:GPH family glycoside/pentoside/hexuronide:cation symporter